MSESEDGDRLVPSQRRLQRAPDFTGDRLDTFTDVFLRHGLPGAMLGLLCLLHPQLRELLAQALAPAAALPLSYIGAALLIFVGLNVYAGVIDRSWDASKAGWVLYLGALSLWEEWVFRLAVPYGAESFGISLAAGVIASNLLFGAVHYFTLRWKWQWCLGAFIGGLALSRQFDEHQNLLLIVCIHWIATFINTPRLPSQSRRSPKQAENI